MSRINIRASRTPQPASEFRLPGTAERAIGRNGEVNASSRADLWQRNMQLVQAASSGMLALDDHITAANDLRKRNADLIKAAFNDPREHKILGERIAESLYMTANRQGFARKFLLRNDVKQGNIPRFPVRSKNVTAVWSTSPTKVDSQITQDKWLTPPELQIVARPFIPQNEINQSADDVLTEKYTEATEAVMVAEDRLLYNLCNEVVGVDNNLSIISGQLTPGTVATVRDKVTRWGLKSPYVLIASDLMTDVIGNSEFHSAMDPVARHQLLLSGELGVMYGMTVVSDAYRHPEHKVLNQGEFFVFADGVNFGAYSDRDGLHSQPIDVSVEKVVGRGWILYESFAIAIGNSRAVAKGIRI